MISAAFFILLFAAAITSGISIVEVSVAAFVERLHMTRAKACSLLFVIIALIAIPATLSFGLLNHVTVIGKNIFDFLDFTTSNILMPLNTFILCIIAAWCLKIEGSMFLNNKLAIKLFDIGLKFIVPIVLLGVMYAGLK
jgi:NSS family neurotransmitter:Na+ symporter